MSTDEALNKAVEQTYMVLELAQKNFYKSLRDYLAEKNIILPAESKDEIGKLFGDTFKTYLMAEMPSFLSCVLYHRLNNPDILIRLAPEFLDACEAMMGDAPEALIKKTDDLPVIAKGFLDSRGKKGDIAEHLGRDLAGMIQVKRLRASFDALQLYLAGE